MTTNDDAMFARMSRLLPQLGFFPGIATTAADMPSPDNSLQQNSRREEMRELGPRQNPEVVPNEPSTRQEEDGGSLLTSTTQMLGLQGLDLAEGRQRSLELADQREREQQQQRRPERDRIRIIRHRPHDTRDMDPKELLARIRQLENNLVEEVENSRQAEAHFNKVVHIMDQEFQGERNSLVDKANRRINALVEARSIRDDKITELEAQVAELKRSISTAGHIRKQVADDELRDGMRRLGHEIQNLVVKRSRQLKLVRKREFLSEPAVSMVSEAIPDYWEMEDLPKNGVCQAIIARQLMRIFGIDGFFGLPHDTPLASISKLMQYFEIFQRDPAKHFCVFQPEAAASNFNEWRRLTMCLLDDVKDEAMVQALAEATDRIVASVDECLGQLLGKPEDSERLKGVAGIVSNAVKLAHMFRMQQARFNFRLPTIGPDLRLQMDPEGMEDIHGENSPELKGRPVLFAILPAVFKFGDERGADMDKKHIVCKLRVLVAEEEE